MNISKATEYNWKKLNSDVSQKLTKRANKTKSTRKVVACNYLQSDLANKLLESLSKVDGCVEDIIFSLCVLLLKHVGIYDRQSVHSFLAKYSNLRELPLEVDEKVWEEGDVLGFVYQSLITEGERNSSGQYYTNQKVVEYMLDGLVLKKGETFCDPCCGSGSFLLNVSTNDPRSLYGMDINPIAVLVASTNLLRKYKDCDFVPNVYCLDFLDSNLFANSFCENIPTTFDYIYTNPPWGADKKGLYAADFPAIKSKEKASMFLCKSLARLSAGGTIHFLLPTSLLKIKTHADIRAHILRNTSIRTIDIYEGRFDGVFTDFFSIKLTHSKEAESQSYEVTNSNTKFSVQLNAADCKGTSIPFEPISDMDARIIKRVESRRNDDLKHSKWALGIVTGDNKGKVKKEKADGLEPVYSGKQIDSFRFKECDSYIYFDPSGFQQCAKEEYFRAKEKLVYKFIAKYPVVAYDNKQRLCLNSANILIPDVEGLSIKSVAGLLNSSLFRFYYILNFPDIKVLKGNLQQIPFPMLDADKDNELSQIVLDMSQSGNTAALTHKLDDFVYSLYEISDTEQRYINARIG